MVSRMKQNIEYLEFAKGIAYEAGGKVTDLFGNEQRYDCDINGAIISTSTVHHEVVELIRKTLK